MEYIERSAQLKVLEARAKHLTDYCLEYQKKGNADCFDLDLEVAVIEMEIFEQLQSLILDDKVNNGGVIVNAIYSASDLSNLATIQRLYRIFNQEERIFSMMNFYKVQRNLIYKCLMHQGYMDSKVATFYLGRAKLNFACYQDKLLLQENYARYVFGMQQQKTSEEVKEFQLKKRM